PDDVECFVPRDAVHPGCRVLRHTVDLPGFQRLYERSLHNILDKFEVVKAKKARHHSHEFAGLMPEEVIHQVVDARRVAHRKLRIDDLYWAHFNAAATLENRTVLRHVSRLVDRFSTYQKISANDFFTFGKRPIRDDLIRRAQDFAGPL